MYFCVDILLEMYMSVKQICCEAKKKMETNQTNLNILNQISKSIINS